MKRFSKKSLTRRQFINASAAGLGSLLVSGSVARGFFAWKKKRPNFLFIISDQQGIDTLSAYNCPYVNTPNMDRLVRRGVTFAESHSTNPVCSPARSSLMTGRMPVETGVISNNRPIHSSCPNIGQWLAKDGYETVYCGKWHLPGYYVDKINGFEVLPTGGGQGDIVDTVVSRTCEVYLKNRCGGKPFLLVASFLQPHDICFWAIKGKDLVPERLPFADIVSKLPPLPPNNKARPKAPKKLDEVEYKYFSSVQWQYYNYIYYRQIEMLDADIGRVLDALEDSGQADNTVIILTSDHGDGRGRHRLVSKWYPYEEAVKVPLIISWPGHIIENHRDNVNLVSGLDVVNTICDYAGIEPPADSLGESLRPLLEGRAVPWREFIVSEFRIDGRMLRTPRYKYVYYKDDPVEQLFDMKEDPWEKQNLYEDPKYASILEDHRRLLTEWNARLKSVEPSPPVGERTKK